MRTRIVFCTAVLAVSSTCAGLAAAEEKQAADLASEFAQAFEENEGSNFFGLWSKADQALGRPDEAAELARELLAYTEEIVPDRQVMALLDSLAEHKKQVLAARLLLQIARGRVAARAYEGSHVVVGQLLVEDEKVDPTLVLAQMPILEEGYFAGEVGDLARPVSFRSHGYQDLDVPLAEPHEDSEALVYVGQVILTPLTADQTGSLRGKVVLDSASSAESAVVTVNVAIPPINTPHNG